MLHLLLACTAPEPPDSAGPGGPAADVVDLAAVVADMPTVVRVSWRSAAATRATVTGTFGEDAVTVEEAEAMTEHEVLLVGIPQRTDVTITVGDEAGTHETTVTTGSLPAWVPDTTYEADVPEAAEGGYTIVPMIDLEGGGVLAYDSAGRAVWAWLRTDEGSMGSLSRARLSLDGRAVLYDTMSGAVDTPGLIVRVPLDGSAETALSVLGIHTDFVELPTGGYAALGWELRTAENGQRIAGDTILEIDADGATHTIWSVFDDFTPPPDGPFEHDYPGDPNVRDWTHVNSLAYDAASDDYYVTGTWNQSVMRIDRGTGALLWVLSEVDGDFQNVGEGRLTWYPHTVQPTPEGLLVFNRGDPLDRSTCSEATDLAVDFDAMTALRARGYATDPCVLVPYLGSAQRLPGGNTLVAWSTAGQLDEATPDGELAWRVSLSLGAGFGFALRVPTLGDGTP